MGDSNIDSLIGSRSAIYYKAGTNQKHRSDGPAYITYHENGGIKFQRYFIDNKLHRSDGPAVSEYDWSGKIRYECYYSNGIIHRLDGPARIHYNGFSESSYAEYYFHGNNISIHSFTRAMEESNNEIETFRRLLNENRDIAPLLVKILPQYFKIDADVIRNIEIFI